MITITQVGNDVTIDYYCKNQHFTSYEDSLKEALYEVQKAVRDSSVLGKVIFQDTSDKSLETLIKENPEVFSL